MVAGIQWLELSGKLPGVVLDGEHRDVFIVRSVCNYAVVGLMTCG